MKYQFRKIVEYEMYSEPIEANSLEEALKKINDVNWDRNEEDYTKELDYLEDDEWTSVNFEEERALSKMK